MDLYPYCSGVDTFFANFLSLNIQLCKCQYASNIEYVIISCKEIVTHNYFASRKAEHVCLLAESSQLERSLSGHIAAHRVRHKYLSRIDIIAVKEALIKGEAIVSDARKSVTESVVKRFNQRFLNALTSEVCLGSKDVHLLKLYSDRSFNIYPVSE